MKARRPKTSKELQVRLDGIREAMRQHASSLPPEQAEERRKKAKKDRWYFFKTYLPHYFFQDSPKFHKDLIKEAGKPGINALAAPRGFSKSTLITMAETLYRAVFKITPFQIIVKESEELSAEEVAAIKLELEENPRIKADFGNLAKRGNWEETDIVTTGGCRILGMGRGQKIRGRKWRQHRPGRIILDDIEDDELVKNPRRVKKLVDWVFQAVFPSMEPGIGILTIVGTMISKRGVLASVGNKEDADVNTRKWAAVDKKGRSIFEARFPTKGMPALKKKVGTKAWRTEYMNDPGDDPDATFQEGWIKRFKPEELKGAKISIIVTGVDPSLESTTKHDFKGIVNIAVVPEFRFKKGPFYLVFKPWLRQTSLESMYNRLFVNKRDVNPTQTGMEINTWQKLLHKEVRNMESKRNVRLGIIGITNNVSKEARIGRLSPFVERGEFLFEEVDPDDPGYQDMEELIDQIIGFDEPSVHDDGPDAWEMAFQLAERFGRKINRVGTW